MKIDEMVSHLQYHASFFNVHMHFQIQIQIQNVFIASYLHTSDTNTSTAAFQWIALK